MRLRGEIMGNTVKTVSGIFVIIMFAKLLGQVREMMLAASYGTAYQATAFLTASQIPLNFFDMILGLAIVSAFVPVFNEYLQKRGKIEANKFAGNFVGVVFIVATVVSVVGVVFSAFIVSKIAGGLNEQTSYLASVLLKILFPSILFTSVAYAYAGILQSYGEFKIPAAMSVISNGVAILYFLFFNKKFGIYGLAISMLIGWIMQLVILIPSLKKMKFSFKFYFGFFTEGMIKVYKLAGPVLVSSWVQPINVMINLYLASFLNNGDAVSAINYANKLYLILASVFTVSVTNLTLPALSRVFSKNDLCKAAEIILNSVKSVILFLLPVLGLFIVFRVPIVEIIYQRGEFDAESTRLTATALGFYSIGMVGFGVQEVMNKTFYAMQKPKVPATVAICTVIVNVILSFSLYKAIGIGGLALSAALAATFGGIVLTILSAKYVKEIKLTEILKIVIKALIATFISVVCSLFIYNLLSMLDGGVVIKLIRLCISGIVAVLVYLVMLTVFKLDEIKYVLKMIKK